SDADDGESHFQTPAAAALAGTYGTFAFNPASGAWGYTLANGAANVQALAGGTIVHDTLMVKSLDGTASRPIDVAIAGTNDGPVALAVSGVADEDGPSVLVSAAFSDVDAGNTHTFAVDTAGTLGSVVNNGDGTFSYSTNGAFETLGAGHTATDTFSYTVTD